MKKKATKKKEIKVSQEAIDRATEIEAQRIADMMIKFSSKGMCEDVIKRTVDLYLQGEEHKKHWKKLTEKIQKEIDDENISDSTIEE